MTLTFEEKKLIDLFRAADDRAREDAISTLQYHPRAADPVRVASPDAAENNVRSLFPDGRKSECP